MRGSAALAAASLVALAAVLAGGSSQAADSQASDSAAVSGAPVEGMPIARIATATLGIFDPPPPGRLAPLYRLADRLHVRTRHATLRSQILIVPGEPWSEARARETERSLRALDIFNSAEVEGSRSGDSTLVTVETHDAWTTSPQFNLERGGARTYGSFQFSERNLFGRAKYIALAYREDPTGISRSIELADPSVLGSRVRASGVTSGGTSGTVNAASIELPFYAEDAPHTLGVRAERVAAEGRLYDGGVEAAIFARRIETVAVFAGLGRRRDGTVARLTGSFLVSDRRLGSSTLAPNAPADFAGGEEVLRLRRLAVEARLWHPRFVERIGVDRLDGIEDFDLGHSLTIAGGFSPKALGGTIDEGYAAARLATGFSHGAGFALLRVAGSTRLQAGPREAQAQVDARWVDQRFTRRHTLVLAALGARGWRTTRDFQLVVGGLNGLRAHDVHALAGDRLWRLNAESRWVIAREVLHLVSFGAAGFWDAARTWGPGSAGAPWQHDAGIGLRLSPPRSALNRVVRLDVAWRISPHGPGPREAVFSFSSSQAF
ncbi:MAG TPA: hypothetical protein VJY35_14450 [Candidatus Eisenbacteria bacterium]|nr:hypothetical protein [Candidatus Eisenbacteria bacterium]